MQSSWQYQQPVRIVFGAGQLSALPAELDRLGLSSAMLVCSPSFERRGQAQQLCDLCQGRVVARFTQVEPNPEASTCQLLVQQLIDHRCDCVVALGGGSVMDVAKAAAALRFSPDKAEDLVRRSAAGEPYALPERHLPVICLPTTAGTGSECTSVAVLSIHSEGLKAPLASPALYAAVAIEDPELTRSMPPRLTACAGMDVLCHAIEAYWGRAHQPLCDVMAVEAARTVLEALPQAYQDGNDLEARTRMLRASLTAGLAFALPKTSSAHACSYPLTALLGITHGEACGLTIDHFIRLNAQHGEPRTHRLAKLLGYDSPEALAGRIHQLKERLGLRTTLRDLHLNASQRQALAQGSHHPNMLNNPITVTDEMIDRLWSELCD